MKATYSFQSFSIYFLNNVFTKEIWAPHLPESPMFCQRRCVVTHKIQLHSQIPLIQLSAVVPLLHLLLFCHCTNNWITFNYYSSKSFSCMSSNLILSLSDIHINVRNLHQPSHRVRVCKIFKGILETNPFPDQWRWKAKHYNPQTKTRRIVRTGSHHW